MSRRHSLLAIGAVLGLGCVQAEVFRSVSATQSRLDLNEARTYERLRDKETTRRSSLVAVDEAALVQKEIRISLFDGQQAQYTVSKTLDGRWKGRGEGGDRFSIRPVGNGRYVGYVIHQRKRYVLSPVAKGVSVLYESDPYFACGVQDVEMSHAR